MGEDTVHGGRLSLEGVAQVWEQSQVVRERMRTSRRLFKSSDDANSFDPRLHMKEVVVNAEILKPLLFRMNRFRTAEGGVSMFKIAQVEKENLCFRIQKLFVVQMYMGAFGSSCSFLATTDVFNLHVRIKLLHRFLLSGVPTCKEDIKKDAWLCKGMCVLVKRKRQRGHRPRDNVFRELLRLLMPSNAEEEAHSGSSGEDGDDDDQSDDGSGSDGDADDASSQCVSSGEEAGMLVSADTGSADEAYEEFMRETASPQQAVPASQDEDLIAKKAHEEFLKEAASPEQAVPASQHEDSIAEKAYQEFLKEAESPKQAVPASPSESLNEMLATMYDSGDEKACEAKSVNDPGHGATIEISDSPVVKVEKTHDFEALSNSPRFKEVRQKLQKLKQLREAKRLKRKEAEHLPGSGAAASGLAPLAMAASDNAETQCVSASDLDDLAGKFRASADAIDVTRRQQLAAKSKAENARKERKIDLGKEPAKKAPKTDVAMDEAADRKPAKKRGKKAAKMDVIPDEDEDEEIAEKPKKSRKKAKAKQAVDDTASAGMAKDAKAKPGKKPKAEVKKAVHGSQNAKPKAALPKADPELEKDVPTNRRMAETSPATTTFARRYKPNGSGLSQSKWIAIRAAFYKNLYPRLEAPSRHEDRHPCASEAPCMHELCMPTQLMQSSWQDLFWKFCVDEWTKNGEEVTMDSVHQLALKASKLYLKA
ncbi:hypothetical protein AK812_SmicGene16289 [Symbiodinium microadriaticum]|uniref:Uncharacterized protein n=1 Tax=Symbiodinium microadriaticum TaxID=2951 RepID=A0A1Q9E0R3_SYMMI|nr:hypothetical protein AK812_SmicGene16289 [Symbiodinium microadriaticum]